jgi:hypothetical protein
MNSIFEWVRKAPLDWATSVRLNRIRYLPFRLWFSEGFCASNKIICNEREKEKL